MGQSAVLKVCYESFYKTLADMGAQAQLFSVEDGPIIDGKDSAKKEFKSTVYLGIADIGQVAQDKNGQNIIVDEISYKEPTRIGFILSIRVVSEKYPDLLEAIGVVIRYFKDNNTIPAGEYSWHGNDGGLIYVESVIREPEGKRGQFDHEKPSLTVEYRIEVGINSEQGTSIRRVEKTDIRGNLIKN
ncbi:hypothetical protein AGMMS49579_23810 [Spirochaetia bacterium]|nr:hypothetical protein AGMMS49579_23810 [Spirochaetia bacterium]